MIKICKKKNASCQDNMASCSTAKQVVILNIFPSQSQSPTDTSTPHSTALSLAGDYRQGRAPNDPGGPHSKSILAGFHSVYFGAGGCVAQFPGIPPGSRRAGCCDFRRSASAAPGLFSDTVISTVFIMALSALLGGMSTR